MEFKADAFAVNEFQELGQSIRHGLQHALIKAFKKNGGNLNPDWLYAALNQSHPSLYERIIAIPNSPHSQSSVAPKKAIKQQQMSIRQRLLEDDDEFDLRKNLEINNPSPPVGNAYPFSNGE